MAYRKIETGTWNDPWFEALTPKAKLLYLYLWTNGICNQPGIYEISEKRIKDETGLPSPLPFEEIQEKVYHNDNIVWVKNFFKYQCQNKDFAQKALAIVYSDFPQYYQGWIKTNQAVLTKKEAELLSLPKEEDSLRKESFFLEHKKQNSNSNSTNHPPTTLEPTLNPPPTKVRIKYRDFVFLYENEYQKLLEEHGEENTKRLLDILDNYKGSKGKTYKDDYRAILSWVVKRLNEDNGDEGTTIEEIKARRIKEGKPV